MTAALGLASAALAAAGVGSIRNPDRALLLFGLAILVGAASRTLALRALGRFSLSRDGRHLAGHAFLLLVATIGLLALINGRVPVFADVRPPTEAAITDFGNAVLGGVVVAVALLMIDRNRRRTEELETRRAVVREQRATLLLLVGLQKDLDGADLSDRDLSWFSLRDRSAEKVRMRRSCFFRSNLEKSVLTGADFSDADMTNAFLAGARMVNADLRRAMLDFAHLQKCDLSGARLYGASLRRAKLNGADLSKADLGAVDLREATLDGCTWRGARYDGLTLFPEGFDPAAHEMTFDGAPRSGTATGFPVCGADHRAEMDDWSDLQIRSSEAFARRISERNRI